MYVVLVLLSTFHVRDIWYPGLLAYLSVWFLLKSFFNIFWNNTEYSEMILPFSHPGFCDASHPTTVKIPKWSIYRVQRSFITILLQLNQQTFACLRAIIYFHEPFHRWTVTSRHASLSGTVVTPTRQQMALLPHDLNGGCNGEHLYKYTDIHGFIHEDILESRRTHTHTHKYL